jgi:hypothetical protein
VAKARRSTQPGAPLRQRRPRYPCRSGRIEMHAALILAVVDETPDITLGGAST